MKVKLNSNVSSCLIGSVSRLPGEVFDVEPEQFASHIMTEGDKPKTVEAEVIVLKEESVVEEKPAKKTRKKKAEEKPVEEAEPELVEQTDSIDASEAS